MSVRLRRPVQNPKWPQTFQAAWDALVQQYVLVLASDGWAELQRNPPAAKGFPQVRGFTWSRRVARAKPLKQACLTVAKDLGLPVRIRSFATLDIPRAKGCLTEGGEVWLNRAYGASVHALTLLHELAHHVLGHNERGVPYAQGEIEAEAACAVLGHALCQEPPVYSAAYVAWYTKGEIKRLQRRKTSVLEATQKLYLLIEEKVCET